MEKCFDMYRFYQIAIIIILVSSCSRNKGYLSDQLYNPFQKTFVHLEDVIADSTYKIVQKYIDYLYLENTLGVAILKKNYGDTIFLSSITNTSSLYATILPFYSIVNNYPILIQLDASDIKINNNDISKIINPYMNNDLIYKEDGKIIVRVNQMITHDLLMIMTRDIGNGIIKIDTLNLMISDVFDLNLDRFLEPQIIDSN